MKTFRIEVRPNETMPRAVNRTFREIKDSVHIELTEAKGGRYTLTVTYVIAGEEHRQSYEFEEVRMEMIDEAKWQIIQKALDEIKDKETYHG